MLKIGVLISGYGSNLQAIIDAAEQEKIPAKVAVVISDQSEAHGLARAKKNNLPNFIVERKSGADRDQHERELVRILTEHQVGLVCLAGYMRIVGSVLLNAYRGKMINIHPSLLPSFPGLHAQKQALDYGVTLTGATVHYVDEGCDTGPIIIQSAVPVQEEDTEATLAARILEQEHFIYSRAIKLIAEDKLKIEGRKVRFK